MTHKLIDIVEREHLKKRPPEFQVGDTVDVHIRIIEGEKERVQVFNGVVIARKAGGVNAMFTVRRIVANEGVERVFMLHSPHVVKVEVKRHGQRTSIFRQFNDLCHQALEGFAMTHWHFPCGSTHHEAVQRFEEPYRGSNQQCFFVQPGEGDIRRNVGR